MTKRSKRFWFIMTVLMCFSLAVGLSLYALKDKVSYFYTPHEITSQMIGKHIRLGGVVKPQSVLPRDHAGVLQFVVIDEMGAVTVEYAGILPDLFREGQTVIVDGVWGGDVFNARVVLAKHDENYKPPELTDRFENDKTLRQEIDR